MGLATATTVLAGWGLHGHVAYANDPEAEAEEARFDREIENELLDRVWPMACQRWRQDDEPFDAGAQAAIRCATPAPAIEQLALFAFPDDDSLRTQFRRRLRRIDERPSQLTSGCADGQEAVTAWEHGQLVCWTERSGSPVARMRWTDERTDTYGVVDAADGDIARLFEWWSEADPSASVEQADLVAADFVSDALIPDAYDERIAYLLAHVGDTEHPDAEGRRTTVGCEPMGIDASTGLQPLSLAAIECEPSGRGRDRYRMTEPMRYFLFPSAEAVDAWWERTLRGTPDSEGPLRPGSGSFGTCFGRDMLGVPRGETAWRDQTPELTGRVACWIDPSGRQLGYGTGWTVAEELIGASGRGLDWFTAVHPDRMQAYPASPSDDAATRPFADPASLSRLPRDLGVEPPPGRGTFQLEPSSVPGLPIGVVHPIPIEQCFGSAGFPADVDGSWWQAVGGADPEGRRIRFGRASREFQEGMNVEFLKIGDDEAQVRSPGGYVVAYVRHEGPRRFRQGCS